MKKFIYGLCSDIKDFGYGLCTDIKKYIMSEWENISLFVGVVTLAVLVIIYWRFFLSVCLPIVFSFIWFAIGFTVVEKCIFDYKCCRFEECKYPYLTKLGYWLAFLWYFVIFGMLSAIIVCASIFSYFF